MEEPQGVLDDVGATDVDMVCSDGRVLNGGGVCWGDHSGWLMCPQGKTRGKVEWVVFLLECVSGWLGGCGGW